MPAEEVVFMAETSPPTPLDDDGSFTAKKPMGVPIPGMGAAGDELASKLKKRTEGGGKFNNYLLHCNYPCFNIQFMLISGI